MDDNPREIAASLVQQFGQEGARMEVLAHVIQAQEEGDNYALSILREVKRILGQTVPADQHAA